MKITLNNNRGITLIELIVTMAVLAILASVILPSAQMTIRRTREIELRRDLRQVRTAIDDYRKAYDQAVADKKMNASLDKSNCPETLQVLIDGYDFGGAVNYKKKFLRKIPADPFNPCLLYTSPSPRDTR